MMQAQNKHDAPGVLGKLLATVVAAILLVLGLMFSVVLLAVVAVVGLAVFGYFWWKTRALRKLMRERPPMNEPGGHVIEGEAVIVEERHLQESTTLPREPPGR